ncbi:MAG: EAL domain-containing protein [Candidatus Sedimenticola sp. (ex Thyasira tokunagai)]
MKVNLRKSSLYFTLVGVIVATVVIVMAVNAAYNYKTTRDELVADMTRKSDISIASLQNNIAGLIESYAVNEYAKLVLTEIEQRSHFAIIVEDYNMGNILGTGSYVSGKTRDNDGRITDYDPENIKQAHKLEECYYSDKSKILSSSGDQLGSITIYITDQAMRTELNEIIINNLINTIAFSLLLIVSLFISIRRFVTSPLSNVIDSLDHGDKDGIPLSPVPEEGPDEIKRLSGTMNRMIGSIKDSRLELHEQQKELEEEKNRFQLAIEGTHDGLWDWDLKTDVVFRSAQFETMLGYEEGELPDTIECWSTLLHPDDAKSAHKKVEDYLDSKGEYPYENTFRMRTKTGQWRWITGRGKALFADNGTPLRFVGFNSDVTGQIRHQEELKFSATHDSLTGLPNRFLFNELIQNTMYHCSRNNKLLALLYIDLDSFKGINDSYGHEKGDAVLVKAARRMQEVLRQEDVVARLGGDEFIIAISDLSYVDEITPLLQRLLDDLNEPIILHEDVVYKLQVSASIGVTLYPQSEDLGPEALLRQADQAMYKAKSSGKNQYCFFDIDSNSSLKKQQQCVDELGRAIEDEQLELHYQPKVDMSNAKVLGFEGLLRWNHPEKGLLYPDSFLPLVHHERKLMLALGKWVIGSALRQLSEWVVAGYDFDVAINISAHEFNNPDTYALLKSLLKRYPDVSPNHVELEILETSALDDTHQAKQMIEACQKLGVRVSLDDFGTGYSTLSYLKDLPVNTLKIDKSFVMDMLDDSASFSILGAAMGLAQAFRCHVVAEGVESVEHGKLLLRLGCRVAQGYVIAKPMSVEEVLPWLKTYKGYPTWRNIRRINNKDWSILYAIVEHRHWLKKLNNFHESPAQYSIPDLDDTRCQLGKWLRDKAGSNYRNDAVLEEVIATHSALHRLASELVENKAAL